MLEKRVIHFGIDESGNGLSKAVYTGVSSSLEQDILFFKQYSHRKKEPLENFLNNPQRNFVASLFEKRLEWLLRKENGETYLSVICPQLIIPNLKGSKKFDNITIHIDGHVDKADRESIKHQLRSYSENIICKGYPKKWRIEKSNIKCRFYYQPLITIAADYLSHNLFTHYHEDLEKLSELREFVFLKV